MNIDELIEALEAAKLRHPLGGKRAVGIPDDLGSWFTSDRGSLGSITEAVDETDLETGAPILCLY